MAQCYGCLRTGTCGAGEGLYRLPMVFLVLRIRHTHAHFWQVRMQDF